MKKNMGNIDRTVRVIIAILIAVLYFTNVISGTAAIILGIIAVAFVLTSMMSFCPLYLPFGWNTAKKEKLN
jgi:small-conductance mechanosensitive channel